MNIIITGAAGLLGSHISRHLLSKGHKIIGIDNFFGGYKDFLPKHNNFEFYNLNLEKDIQGITDIFEKHGPEVVYHFAAYAAEGLSPFIRNFNYTNNVLASVNVINACIKYKSKLIFTSSMAVYGNQQPPFTETLPQKPIDPYGIAKYTVEMDILTAHEQFDLRYNIIRPHNVLGIYQNIWDRYRNVIGIFIRKTLNEEPILVYGDGEQTRAFSDIKYYIEPFDRLLTDKFNGELFNIGADKYFTLNEVAETVQLIGLKYGYSASIQHGAPRHEAKHAYCDHTKAKNMLGFKDETNLVELIESLFVWAMNQPNRKVKNIEYELTDGMYEYWQ